MKLNDPQPDNTEKSDVSSFSFEIMTKVELWLSVLVFLLITFITLFSSGYGPEAIHKVDTTNFLENKESSSESNFIMKFNNISEKNKFHMFYLVFRRPPLNQETTFSLTIQYSYQKFLDNMPKEPIVPGSHQVQIHMENGIIESKPFLFHTETKLDFDTLLMNCSLIIGSSSLSYSTFRWVYENPKFYYMINIYGFVFFLFDILYIGLYLIQVFLKSRVLIKPHKITISLLVFAALYNKPISIIFDGSSLAYDLISAFFDSAFLMYFMYYIVSLFVFYSSKQKIGYYPTIVLIGLVIYYAMNLLDILMIHKEPNSIYSTKRTFQNLSRFTLFLFYTYTFIKCILIKRNSSKSQNSSLSFYFNSIFLAILIWSICNFAIIYDPSLLYAPYRELYSPIIINIVVLFFAEMHFPSASLQGHTQFKKGRSSSAWSYSPGEVNRRGDDIPFQGVETEDQ